MLDGSRRACLDESSPLSSLFGLCGSCSKNPNYRGAFRKPLLQLCFVEKLSGYPIGSEPTYYIPKERRASCVTMSILSYSGLPPGASLADATIFHLRLIAFVPRFAIIYEASL